MYGFTARNDANNVVVSDKAYNTVYIGKAVLQQAFGVFYGGRSSISNAVANKILRVYRYRIETSNRDVIPFLYTSSGYATISSMQRAGTGWDIYVAALNGAAIEIYCFAKSQSAGKTGWGLSLYDQAGSLTFTTTDNNLLLKGVYDANTANSSVVLDDALSDDLFVPRTAAPILANSPLSPILTPPAKPAIHYNSTGVAACANNSNGATGAYWDSCFLYQTNGILLTHWAVVAVSPGVSYQTPAQTRAALLIDGADYD